MSKEKVDVILDSNEAAMNPKIAEILVLHEDVNEYREENLEWGDIIIGDCIFERKTPSDLSSSIQDGRIREQVEGMASEGMKPYILIEGGMGDFESLTHTDLPGKSLRGMVASIIGRNNIHVVFCEKPEWLADTAVRIARKTVEDPSAVHVHETEMVRDPPFIVKVFMAIDGVGLSTAEDIAAAMGSLEAAMEASREDFMGIEGVGKKTSKKIFDELHSGVETTEEETETRVYTV